MVKSLFDHAVRVTTTPEDLRNENMHLRNVLEANGYPGSFIDNSLLFQSEASLEDDKSTKFLTIPYVSGVSERICRRYKIKVALRSGNTIRQYLTRIKGQLLIHACRCSRTYIGETIRRLDDRLKEHREACELGETEKSAVAEHVWKEQHQMDWGKTGVVDCQGGQN